MLRVAVQDDEVVCSLSIPSEVLAVPSSHALSFLGRQREHATEVAYGAGESGCVQERARRVDAWNRPDQMQTLMTSILMGLGTESAECITVSHHRSVDGDDERHFLAVASRFSSSDLDALPTPLPATTRDAILQAVMDARDDGSLSAFGRLDVLDVAVRDRRTLFLPKRLRVQ